MKKTSILICLILIFFGTLSSTGINDKFKIGINAYEKGNYDKALKAFSSIEKKISNWKVFYNKGNCFYKKGNFINAKIEYLKAEKLNPFESSIQNNIVQTNLKLGISNQIKQTFFYRIMLRLDSFFSMNFVSILLIFSIVLFNVILILFLFLGKNKKLIYTSLISVILLIALAGYHHYRSTSILSSNNAVVIDKNAELRSGPGEKNTILYKILPGVRVKIIEKSGDWYYISESETVAGWIFKNFLTLI